METNNEISKTLAVYKIINRALFGIKTRRELANKNTSTIEKLMRDNDKTYDNKIKLNCDGEFCLTHDSYKPCKECEDGE